MKRYRSCLAILVSCILCACTTPQPEPLKPLKVVVFPGGFNWPIWVAAEKGFFAANGLSPTVTPTPNSQAQITGLINGEFDVAMTAIDNLVAYKEGQVNVKIDGNDLIAVMGGDNGFLKLVAGKNIHSISNLKGKELSVDSLTTGYAFVLLEILERNGLFINQDYKTVAAGGVMARYSSLLEGKHAATLLVSPFEVTAKAKGFNQLADASAALGSYQGLVGGVRKSWARDNEKTLIGYIKAYQQALNWLYRPENKEEALSLFSKNVPNASRQAAEISYTVLLDPNTGFQRDAAIEIDGVKNVLSLRSKYGRPKKLLTDPASYYESKYFDQAMRLDPSK